MKRRNQRRAALRRAQTTWFPMGSPRAVIAAAVARARSPVGVVVDDHYDVDILFLGRSAQVFDRDHMSRVSRGERRGGHGSMRRYAHSVWTGRDLLCSCHRDGMHRCDGPWVDGGPLAPAAKAPADYISAKCPECGSTGPHLPNDRRPDETDYAVKCCGDDCTFEWSPNEG